MTPATQKFIEEVEGRLKGTTDGPWEVVQHKLSFGIATKTEDNKEIRLGIINKKKNAELVSHSRTDLEKLLTLVKQQDKEIQVLREALVNIRLGEHCKRAMCQFHVLANKTITCADQISKGEL